MMLAKQQDLLALCKEVLRDDYLYLELLRYEVREDLVARTSLVRCDVRDTAGREYDIEGRGVGGLDAFFQGMKDQFAREHLSLNTIAVKDFRARGKMETREQQDGADAQAEVLLEIENSYGKRFHFTDTSRSVVRSAIIAMLSAVEYFVNSERAIIGLRQAIEHARAANRADTVAHATEQMADLVENTSYTEVIQRIRDEIAAGDAASD